MATTPPVPYFDTMQLTGNKSFVCADTAKVASMGGVYMHHSPLKFSAPLLLLQLSLISITSKLIGICLKPLGQSSIVSQIYGGIVYGPSLLGHEGVISRRLFPPKGAMILETFATFGLMFFLFTIGVKMDAKMMVRPEKKAMAIGVSVMFFTLALTAPLSLLLKKYLPMDDSLANALPYIAASQCLTPFPNIACLLAELKILNTDLGRLAVSSAMVCDVIGVSLTAVGFSVLNSAGGRILPSLWGFLTTVGLLVVIVYAIRPLILWILHRTPEGEPLGQLQIHCILTTVLVAGLLSEVIGQHFVLGSLVLGLAVPEGPPLGAALASKMDCLVSGLLYPTYLTVSGLKTDIFKIHLRSSWIVGVVVLFASLVKIGAVILPACCSNIPVRDALVIGLVMNARGIFELILYNLWRGGQILTDQEFALSVISVIGVTAIITPLIVIIYDPSKQNIPNKRMTLQHARKNEEIRILVCIQNQDSVPSIINLLEASSATEQSPIAAIAVLLVELVGRSNPILVEHKQQQLPETSTSVSSHILNALRHYELYNEGGVTVRSFSSISYFDMMHDDIFRVARDQNANIVILPFHRQFAIDGSIGSANRGIRAMNIKVLSKAPCSVGILVDRGVLSGSVSILNTHTVYHVAVIYIGGADDVEALTYGARMARHENVTLTVIRFLLFGSDNARGRKLDNDIIDEVRHANAGSESFFYTEEVVKDGVGLASSIRATENCFDLMLVGRSHQESPLLLGLDAWSECRELGVIGDMLASPDFGSTSSVLVVQQQRTGGKLMKRTAKQEFCDGNPLLHCVQRHGAPATSADNNTWTISMDRV